MSKNQQKIKSFLHQVSSQNLQQTNYNIRQTLHSCKNCSNQTFENLSDWNNGNSPLLSLSLPKFNLKQALQKTNLKTYRSYLLKQSKNSQVSPLIKSKIIKFNPRSLVSSLRRTFIASTSELQKRQVSKVKKINHKRIVIHKVAIGKIQQLDKSTYQYQYKNLYNYREKLRYPKHNFVTDK